MHKAMISEYQHLATESRRNNYFLVNMIRLDDLYDNSFEVGEIEIIEVDLLICQN